MDTENLALPEDAMSIYNYKSIKINMHIITMVFVSINCSSCLCSQLLRYTQNQNAKIMIKKFILSLPQLKQLTISIALSTSHLN